MPSLHKRWFGKDVVLASKCFGTVQLNTQVHPRCHDCTQKYFGRDCVKWSTFSFYKTFGYDACSELLLVTINNDDLSTCKPDEGEKSKTGLRCEVLDERDANDNAP